MSKDCIFCFKVSKLDERGFCSEECYEKHCVSMLRYNLKGVLGLGFIWERKCNLFELLKIKYTWQNLDTGKIETNEIDFTEE